MGRIGERQECEAGLTLPETLIRLQPYPSLTGERVVSAAKVPLTSRLSAVTQAPKHQHLSRDRLGLRVLAMAAADREASNHSHRSAAPLIRHAGKTKGRRYQLLPQSKVGGQTCHKHSLLQSSGRAPGSYSSSSLDPRTEKEPCGSSWDQQLWQAAARAGFKAAVSALFGCPRTPLVDCIRPAISWGERSTCLAASCGKPGLF